MSAATDHLDKAAAFIAVAESGDAKIAAYRQAADEIIAAQDAEPGLSLREVDRRLGKGTSYAQRLVKWRRDGDPHHVPFGGPVRNEQRYRGQERQVPTRTEDRVEMARTLLKDDAVVEAVAAEPAVEREVETKQAERKFEQEQRRAKPSSGTPLSAYFHRLVGAIRKTVRDLEFIRGELGTLTDTEKQKVDDVLVEVIATAESCRLELFPDRATGIDEGLIEGVARDKSA